MTKTRKKLYELNIDGVGQFLVFARCSLEARRAFRLSEYWRDGYKPWNNIPLREIKFSTDGVEIKVPPNFSEEKEQE